MYEQVKALREGKSVDKPIYNHASGLLDPAEKIEAPKILVIEGLHPFLGQARPRPAGPEDLPGHLGRDQVCVEGPARHGRARAPAESTSSIESRKPDFDAYVDPQKKFADIIIQVLPTQLIPDEKEGKVLRVRMIQKYGKEMFTPRPPL